MVLFILFNGGDLSKNQWTHHPFTNEKTKFLDELQKLGKTYTSNPVFYNFNRFNKILSENSNYDTDIQFNIEDIEFTKYCESVYNEVKDINEYYILIAHSRGYFFASKFAELYKDKVKGLFVIDGQIALESWMSKWLMDDKMKQIKEMTNEDLKELLNTIKTKKDNDKEIRQVSQLVKYHTYKQYTNLPKVLLVPTYFISNLDDEDNLMKSQRYEYDESLKKQNSYPYTKYKYYHNRSHFLYFDETDDIIFLIKDFVDNLKLYTESKTMYNDLKK